MRLSYGFYRAIGAFLSGSIFLFSSCHKSGSNDPGTARFELRLTDGPASYDAIYIDIRQIEVNSTTDSSSGEGWQTLPLLKPGIYKLTDFKNGMDTLLSAADIPAGNLSQIRLVLGDNNSVVVNGQPYPLMTPSTQQSGLKLNIHATLTAGIVYRLWIDFDANRSVVQAGNSGKYNLKPVIRTYTEATGGSIKGFVLPPASLPQVWAIQGTDSLFALPDSTSGYYFFGGVNAGNWHVAIHAENHNYQDTSFIITVADGTVTNAGTTTLPLR